MVHYVRREKDWVLGNAASSHVNIGEQGFIYRVMKLLLLYHASSNDVEHGNNGRSLLFWENLGGSDRGSVGMIIEQVP